MDNLERNIKTGSLYCLDKKLGLKKIDSDYIITNGPAFINKNFFYHTDSRLKRIYKIRINNNLEITKKKIFIRFNKKDGSPDGMTVDDKKNLWVCHYKGGCISVFDKNGKKIHKINMPAKNITNCVFGGVNNNELYVTTALKGISSKDIKVFSDSGSLFKINTNVKGNYSKSFGI